MNLQRCRWDSIGKLLNKLGVAPAKPEVCLVRLSYYTANGMNGPHRHTLSHWV